MLSTTAKLLNQLDATYWEERFDRSEVEINRGLEGIEPVTAVSFLVNEKKPNPGVILFFDNDCFEGLQRLNSDKAEGFLNRVIDFQSPFVLVAEIALSHTGLLSLLEKHCLEKKVCLVQTKRNFFQVCLDLQNVQEKLQVYSLEVHGTMVDVFGLGVLLTGASGIGKSETALGLIERRHRLIGDDLVRLVKQGQSLVASSTHMTRHHIEIRGIGILNIAHMFGIVSVEESKKLDMVVELENWSTEQDYDRMGLEWHYKEFLDVEIPHHRLPVKPGRDLVLLIETIVLNHRLRQMGFNSAKEIQRRLHEEINKKTSSKQESNIRGSLS